MTIYILIDEMGHEIDRSKDKVRIEKALSNNPECKIKVINPHTNYTHTTNCPEYRTPI